MGVIEHQLVSAYRHHRYKLETLLEAWFIARRANNLIITHDLLVE